MPASSSLFGTLTGPAELIPAIVVTVVMLSAALALVLAAVGRRDPVPARTEQAGEESRAAGARYSRRP